MVVNYEELYTYYITDSNGKVFNKLAEVVFDSECNIVVKRVSLIHSGTYLGNIIKFMTTCKDDYM